MLGPLQGQVCVVTGASRGIGRGIALQLCEAGATVYITGRNQDTLQAAAQEAQSRGGRCLPVVCDSSQEDEVRSLFERVDREQNGRLDVLVNNAYAGVKALISHMKKPFWECPASIWDDINNVGLRGHYLCSVYGARLMVPAGRGLIVVISSLGGLQYIFNVAYGVGKAACDRLATDCAQELRRHGIAYVSLWPGMVKTELVMEHLNKEEDPDPIARKLKERLPSGETPELSGKCVVALATDPNILQLSGRVLPSCDLAKKYGFKDVDGRPVFDYLSLQSVLSEVPRLAWLASYVPSFLRIPKWIMVLYSSKF
ncbi:dehydrogenase/reductase SDR family member 1 [Antechinus flavipes]|uniref:dehydrogenase/reductase SDR family member 1 n=1 Tax=Antechinus flavipes TaxID=38775 RepID=UPI0022357024|nr:dehydrogenase/reductase SDR family member 1 [Antechinus flavipes]XP_051836510.1 dehydrogenase/reductase SDR family member 1 [Antechinus flavipes]XP_051836511.1 dehydrogenase/reductase SDR family member 1 [Antechinus flavipes]XP_051836513.1 dehydrogenase/reductase SDR family member 1 [Antechinus flavipes]